MTTQLIIPTRTVEDIDFNFRTMVNVKFEDSETWEPFTLEDVGETMRQMGMVDGYDQEKQTVWVEREVDSRFDRARNQYEPVFQTRSADIRDFMRDLDWKDYNRIFAGAGM